MYDSAVAAPLILAGPDVPVGAARDVSVSLVDAFPTICEGVGAPLEAADADLPGMSLWPLAQGEGPASRTTFAEYHASGSVSGAFMLRDERWKYVHYHGFPPQLFDLVNDPEERRDLAGDPSYAAHRRRFDAQLRAIVDPEAIEAEAKAAQRRLVERSGGEAAVRAAGAQINFTRAPRQFW